MAKGLEHDTCAATGCERPYAWCELHHRQPWAKGGKTDLANAIPLCHQHHQWIHDTGFNHQSMPDGSVRFSGERDMDTAGTNLPGAVPNDGYLGGAPAPCPDPAAAAR